MASTTDARGKVDLDPGRIQGLPFLKPLYGPGPYVFTNGAVLMLSYEADPEAIRECLPRQLEPTSSTVSWMLSMWPECTGIGPHDFAMPILAVRYGDFAGQWVPYLYTSTDASLACYREVQGWPAVLAEVRLVAAEGRVHAEVNRGGRRIVEASAEVGGDTISDMGEFAPLILYKEIPNLDTTGTDVGTFITSTSGITEIAFKAGTGSFSYPDPGDDPVARLAPKGPVGAIYGSFRDHYPETIRRLDPLPD